MKNIVTAEELTPEEALAPTDPKPWVGSTLTSLTKDLKLEDPKAEFVAIGYPNFRRSPSGQTYIQPIPGLDLEIVGYADDLHCVVCRINREAKSAGTPAKT